MHLNICNATGSVIEIRVQFNFLLVELPKESKMPAMGEKLTIHEFAHDGNIPGVLDELDKGTDVDARFSGNDRTPLMVAIASPKASPDLVSLLIQRGANTNASAGDDVKRRKEYPLSIAVGTGNFRKIELLLNAGADVGYARRGGYHVLIDAMYHHDIVRDADLIRVIKLLIERGARLDSETAYSESAVKAAANAGRFDAVRVLLDAGADPAPLQWTPLMNAIVFGSLDGVNSQLGNGADLAARDFWSRTAWLLSVHAGDVSKSKMLLKAGARRSDRGRCGQPAMVYAITNENIEMLRWLLSEGFDPNEENEFGTTPLIEAVSGTSIECVKILIQAGADIHHRHYSEPVIKSANKIESVRLLVDAGADLNDINDEMRAALAQLPNDKLILVNQNEYLAGRDRRFGHTNPEKMNIAFWKSMINSGANAYAARKRFEDLDYERGPVWCFQRYGKSINELPDGRIIEIAGEHEDSYDPDFCIYNDVIVHHGDRTFDIYGYPEDVFPPTDFHTATLVGDYIYLIGSLGYIGKRMYGESPVYRLNTTNFEIEKLTTWGDKPGWINRHKATYSGDGEIHVSAGKVCVMENAKEEYKDNLNEYVLDLQTLEWKMESARSKFTL